MTAKLPAHEGFLTPEEVLEYLQANLDGQHDGETAVDGAGALDAHRCAGAHYDLMISDLNMPEPLRDTQVLEAADWALGAPAA